MSPSSSQSSPSASVSAASTSRFATQTYIFDPRPAYPLQIAVKRHFQTASGSYRTGSYLVDATSGNTDAQATAPTLVFTHGTGFHKELWEPVIHDLVALVELQEAGELRKEKGGVRVRVGDIWTVDCPNHGDSAGLNEEVLKYGYDYNFGWEEYGRVVHMFVNGLGRLTQVGGVGHRQRVASPGPGVWPFARQSVIGVGHSMGSVALALSLTYAPSPTNSFTPHPSHPIKSLILVEPMIMIPVFALGESARLIAGVERRRDTWPSRREAREAMGKSLGRQKWEGRCIRCYAECGIRPVDQSTSTAGKDDEDGPVTLKCTKVQEAACYRDPLGPIRLYASFGALVKSLPVHVMYGAVDDYLPAAVKTDVIENQAGGVQNLASFTRVPGGGHLVPYQSPTALAEKIFDALALEARSDSNTRAGRVGGAGKTKL